MLNMLVNILGLKPTDTMISRYATLGMFNR